MRVLQALLSHRPRAEIGVDTMLRADRNTRGTRCGSATSGGVSPRASDPADPATPTPENVALLAQRPPHSRSSPEGGDVLWSGTGTDPASSIRSSVCAITARSPSTRKATWSRARSSRASRPCLGIVIWTVDMCRAARVVIAHRRRGERGHRVRPPGRARPHHEISHRHAACGSVPQSPRPVAPPTARPAGAAPRPTG